MELLTGEPNSILDSPLDDNSEPSRFASIGPNQVCITELSPADARSPTQLLLLERALGLMQSLAITEALPPNYSKSGLGAECWGM